MVNFVSIFLSLLGLGCGLFVCGLLYIVFRLIANLLRGLKLI
jgi:hypothetical protein